MRRTFTLLCLIVPLMSFARGARGEETARPASFVEYLAGQTSAPFYIMELRRLAVEEGNVFALREYAGLLHQAGRYDEAAAFADSVGTDDGEMGVIRSLIKVEGLLDRREFERAVSAVEEITPSFPSRPLLIELQYFKGNALFGLGRFEEARAQLTALEDELEGSLRLAVLHYLARCEEELGHVERAKEIYSEAHEAGLGGGTAGLIRCLLREGDVDGAVDAQREALVRGIGLPVDDVHGLLDLSVEAAPELWHALARMLAADTTYAPGRFGFLVNAAESGVDAGPYCEALLQRFPGSPDLRYARAVSSADKGAAFDSLYALVGEHDSLMDIRCVISMLMLAADDESLSLRDDSRVKYVGNIIEKGLPPNEMYIWLDLLVRNGLTEGIAPRAAKLQDGLHAGFDDAALLDLASLMERAGETERALALYREISASPVPSRSTFEAERRIHLIGLVPPEGQDVSAIIEQVAREERSNTGLARVFDERIRDYAKAAEYYQRAFRESEEAAEKERLRFKAAMAFAKDYLKTGSSPSRDKALNMATGMAASEAVDPGGLLVLLKASTDWLTLDLFRATEVARTLSTRKDNDAQTLYDLSRIAFRLYERGDPQGYELCSTCLSRLLYDHASSPEVPRAAFLTARLKLASGDYAGSLEAYGAALKAADGRILRELCNLGMGDCYVGSGGIEQGLEHYARAGDATVVALRRARCNLALGNADLARIHPDRYASQDVWLGAGMCGMIAAWEATDMPFISSARILYADRDLHRSIDDLRQYQIPLHAYVLAHQHYDGLAVRLLEEFVESPLPGFHCQVLLSTYDPVEGDHKEFYRALAQRLAPNCKDALDAYAHLKLKAELGCSSDSDELCFRDRTRFTERHPLASRAANDIDAIRATSLYREMYVGRADAIVDTLFAQGIRDELVAEAVYRKGVSFLLDKANQEAKRTFLIMKDYFPGSRLYPDVCFKLGTTCYLMEAYDSSAVFFRLAAEQEKVALLEDALFNLGLALEESGDLAAASEAFLELAARFPFSARFERALMRSGYCLEQNDLPLEARDVYKTLLKYARSPGTRAEANFWLGECLAKAGRHVEAALEFMRTGFFYPGEGAWAGTARYRAGVECENAGLRQAAKVVYEENVMTFGRESTWGKASFERLSELGGEG